MSREIKFRVWNTQEGKFHLPVEGDRLDSVLHYWEITKHVEFPQQFTGLKDKNGKEIYEGDILDSKCAVSFNDGMFGIFDKHTYMGLNSYMSKFREVIGNIYETPELLY